jgi:hypothetical protein
LRSLERNVRAEKDIFNSLNLILKQCACACDNLSKVVLRVVRDSKQFKGIKVWIKLKRQESDIKGFKRLIDSYKATLTIAVADANL